MTSEAKQTPNSRPDFNSRLTKTLNFETPKQGESPRKENKVDPEVAQQKMMGMVGRVSEWNAKKHESK